MCSTYMFTRSFRALSVPGQDPVTPGFCSVCGLVLGQDAITLSPGVGPESAGLARAQHPIKERRRLALPAPGHGDLSAQLVKGLGHLAHLVGGRHLGEVAVKILGQDLA